MTLILTVKPGEDDYLDTSFLLRQASPYMKIKYSNLEEFPNLPCLKRTTAHSRSEHLKRRKFNGLDSSLGIAGKNDDGVDDYHISEKEVRSEKLQEKKNASPKCLNTAHMRVKIIDNHHAETQRVRNDEVMCNFAKALWNVLKQYKQKLTESDKEIQKLKDALRKENTLVSKLEKELEELRSCSCCKHPSIENSPPKEEVLSTFSTTGSLMKSLEQESLKYIDGVHGFNSVEDDCDTLDSCISTDVSKGCQQPLFQNPGGEDVEANRVLLDERSSEGTLSPLSSPLVLGRTRVEENKMTGQMVDSFSKIKYECLPSQTEVKPTDQKGESLPGKKHSVADLEEMNIHRAYLVSTSSENSDNLDRSLPPPVNLEDNENVQRPQFNEKVETCNTRNSSLSMDGEIMKKCHKVNSKSMPLLELHPAVVTDDGPSDESEARELSVKIQSPAFKPPNAGKPRIRKLVPASAMLLKEFSGLEVDVENAKV
ncbi:hypothetical protein J5N97_022812 [Dioscorea zingiberensis]|uniref:Uncharacterized protein n=1 Tax=Dioscorea zingiberensis TaxID=325984 RepID=A0A9D5CBW7_9LILI|nr:hypothetical protein J5N97_022812 [Dioscorea zingiberensis]